jgi:hypothetical protein
MSDPRETGPLYSGDVLDLLVQLQTEIAGLRAENMALKDEIRRLKGLPPRPKVKPSGMEASSKRGSDRAQSPKRRGSSRAIISEERHLGCVAPRSAFPGSDQLHCARCDDRCASNPLFSRSLAFAGRAGGHGAAA